VASPLTVLQTPSLPNHPTRTAVTPAKLWLLETDPNRRVLANNPRYNSVLEIVGDTGGDSIACNRFAPLTGEENEREVRKLLADSR